MRFLSFAVLLLLLTGCDSSGGGNGILSADVSGAGFDATTGAASGASGLVAIVAVEGTGSSQRSFSLLLPGTAGTYASGGANALLAVSYSEGTGNAAQTWAASGGLGTATVTVASVTAERVSGTFTATLQSDDGTAGTKSITGGEFNVAFGFAGN